MVGQEDLSVEALLEVEVARLAVAVVPPEAVEDLSVVVVVLPEEAAEEDHSADEEEVSQEEPLEAGAEASKQAVVVLDHGHRAGLALVVIPFPTAGNSGQKWFRTGLEDQKRSWSLLFVRCLHLTCESLLLSHVKRLKRKPASKRCRHVTCNPRVWLCGCELWL